MRSRLSVPRSASSPRSSGSSRWSCSSLPHPTSPASPWWPTASPSCSARSSVRRVGTHARRSACRCCRSTPPSRSSWSWRSERDFQLGVLLRVARTPRQDLMQRVQLPPELVEGARAFADGSREPAEPRNAATVVLRRQTSMAFAGGMCVFPGGGVDARDFDHAVAWTGPAPDQWAARLGTDEATARALVCAAVRETFEESGVLLAGESADTVVADPTGESWETDRAALEARELAFTEFLDRRGLVLRTDLLGVWAAWLTPVFEPRRFRTWFFVADLPEGQRTRDVSTESDQVTWRPAMQAVRDVEEKQLLMLPPTYLTCLEIGQYADPAGVLDAAHGRSVEMFMPEVEQNDDGGTLSIPPRFEALLESRTEAGQA